MVIPKLKIINCCVICCNLKSDKEDAEYLYMEYEENSKTIINLTEMGYLYEELIGSKILLEANEYYPKFLCSSCTLQMNMFKKFKTKALKSWELLIKEFCNREKISGTLSSIELDVMNADLIEYEQIEFIHDENNHNVQNDNNNNNDYNKIVMNSKQQFNKESTELSLTASVNNVSTSFINDHLANNKNINDVVLELIEEINETDFIKKTYEIPGTDSDGNCEPNDRHVTTNEAVNIMEKVYKNQERPKWEVKMSALSLFKKELKCDLCQINFESLKHMKAHGISVHNGKYPCGHCQKLFTSIKSLRVHTNLHKGQLRYHCDLCTRDFNQKVHYQTHMRRHKSYRNFQCSKCEKAFFTKTDLKTHERTHNGYRPHVCDVCGKDFILAIHLKTHQYSHATEKKFPCDYCKQKFMTPNALSLHKQTIHLQQRQFKCEHCGKSFRRKHHLMYHVKNVHRNDLIMMIAEEQKNREKIFEFSKLSTKPTLITSDYNNFLNHIDDNENEQFIEFINDALII